MARYLSGLNEHKLYDMFQKLNYIVPQENFSLVGYPSRDLDFPGLRKAPVDDYGQKKTLRAIFSKSYTCHRCKKNYNVEPNGVPSSNSGYCRSHLGRVHNFGVYCGPLKWSCCGKRESAPGCYLNEYHVHRGELELANFEGYVETQPKPERGLNKHCIFALDCEMCYTTYGLELTRITVVNHEYDVVYEKLVRPKNPILDYNNEHTRSINKVDLDKVQNTLADVQRDLLDMFSSDTILVGHSLDCDMKALKIFHKRFVDTTYLFPHERGLPYRESLETLMSDHLGVTDDSIDNARAALRLAMWRAYTTYYS